MDEKDQKYTETFTRGPRLALGVQGGSPKPKPVSPPTDPLPDIQLCLADEATFWPWRRWPEFANWPDKERTVVVLPIAGFADYGLGAGLDAEEAVLMSVLREASLRRSPDLAMLVIPPVRFALGPKPYCAFPIDPDAACELLEEVLGWVDAAGFSKVLLLNASPWNEEVTKAVGRDVRIARGLQMYCIQLSSLGLDFDPVRGGDRAKLKALLAALLGGDPALAGTGANVLAEVSSHLVSLLSEIRNHPPLAADGVLTTKTWP